MQRVRLAAGLTRRPPLGVKVVTPACVTHRTGRQRRTHNLLMFSPATPDTLSVPHSPMPSLSPLPATEVAALQQRLDAAAARADAAEGRLEQLQQANEQFIEERKVSDLVSSQTNWSVAAKRSCLPVY